MHIKFPIVLLLIFAVVACKDDRVPYLDDFISNVYSGCCNTEPFELSVDTLFNYYIPNIATPDADGINDFWLVFGQAGGQIRDLTIKDRSGNTIYQDSTVAAVGVPDNGWDMQLETGEVYLGLFKYSLVILVPDGTMIDVEGSACSFICDPEISSSIADPSGCAFPIQHNGDGTFDPTLDKGEQDCF